jgi:uncharacterized protein YraI
MVSASVAVAAPAYVLTNVNLRSGPGTTNEIVGRIPGGSRVEANNCKDGWCEVSWNGKNGFAIQTALDLSGRAPVRRRTYGPGYVGPPVYYPPSPYYYGPAPYYYYGPRYYYGYGPYWRRRHWW